MWVPSSDEAALVGASLDILEALHLQLRDVSLLRTTVARVEDARRTTGGLRKHLHHSLAKLRWDRRTTDSDVTEAQRQALLREKVEHCRYESPMCSSMFLGELVEFRGQHYVLLALWEKEASASRHQGTKEVVQEGHPSRGVVAQSLCSRRHALGLCDARHQRGDVAMGEHDALGLSGGATGEEHQSRVSLMSLAQVRLCGVLGIEGSVHHKSGARQLRKQS
mmetsp:Transcript_136998/g.324555  ORF Transcript_136998/g.324555 Transcript_136998/m.324555 type:complete len:222 (-) Transcript_136998:1118-1783(-)